ncbi:uncharacterized protein LOC134232815 [Saccostrea cucullata]|uniref:uncharacterized protein LOC134232815 n=1 Tax=Saccostrea cuccullata TaxID=36930 RepID=UPI002ED25F2B
MLRQSTLKMERKALKSISLFIVFNILPHAIICDRYCEWSKKSMTIANSCPTNKADFQTASKTKNCESMAEKQNCTEKSKFKYHCLINELEEVMVEVCAPEFYIQGYCTEYNINGARIQDHLYLRNGSIAVPFTSRYISTDAYKYSNCYSLVSHTNSFTSISTFIQTTVKSSNSSNEMPIENEMPKDKDITPMALVIPIVIVILIFLGAIIFYLYKHSAKKRMAKNTTSKHEPEEETHLMDPTNISKY